MKIFLQMQVSLIHLIHFRIIIHLTVDSVQLFAKEILKSTAKYIYLTYTFIKNKSTVIKVAEGHKI